PAQAPSAPLPAQAPSAPLPAQAPSAPLPVQPPITPQVTQMPAKTSHAPFSVPYSVIAASAPGPSQITCTLSASPSPGLLLAASVSSPQASSETGPMSQLAGSVNVSPQSASVQLPLQITSAPTPMPSGSTYLPLLASSSPSPLQSLPPRLSASLPPLSSYATVPLPSLTAFASATPSTLPSSVSSFQNVPACATLPFLPSSMPAAHSLSVSAGCLPSVHPVNSSLSSAPLTSTVSQTSSLASIGGSTAVTSTAASVSLGNSTAAPTSLISVTPRVSDTIPPLVSRSPSSVTVPCAVNSSDNPLSLSVAGPPSVSVTLSTPTDPDVLLDCNGSRSTNPPLVPLSRPRRLLPPPPRSPFYLEPLEDRRKRQKMERLERIFQLNERRCGLAPVYGTEVLQFCTLRSTDCRLGMYNYESYPQDLHHYWFQTDAVKKCIFTPEQRLEQLGPLIERFIFAMPPVEAPQITLHTSHPPPSMLLQESVFRESLCRELTPATRCLHRIVSNMRTQFPDLRLIQYDCGKLQTLDRLLRHLKSGGHRVLLFTQMTRMLDVLEQFLNYHGHIYLRLDGSTRIEQRQVLMERFNMDRRIFCFILSTRSGGVGVNLTGADTVIFYDSDWNPTMDAQAQDRCHRIGQTRDVHIYRLVSDRTVEENILKKAQQKRMLGDMAIEGGNFTTAYFKQQTIRELFDMEETQRRDMETGGASPERTTEDGSTTRNAHMLEQALCGAEDEEDTLAASLVRAEQVADLAEFNENAPLEPEEEEPSRAEQEINALVEQLTPIERYAMYFLEASLEDVSREELKQAEEQVEAARKDLFSAKDDVPCTEDTWDEENRKNRKSRAPPPSKPPGERVGVRMSERLRGVRTSDGADLTDSPAMLETTLPAEESLEDGALLFKETENITTDLTDSHIDTEAPSSPSLHQCPLSPLPPATSPPIQTSPQTKSLEKEKLEPEPPVSDNETQLVPKPESPLNSSSSVVSPEKESPAPRTPRRKVTADTEILMAGAGDSSPTEKVLRRLPGRLVTVVQERPAVPRRQNRSKGNCPLTDKGPKSPADPQSPPAPCHQSDETSDTGSPPPKRKRGRPPKCKGDMSLPGAHSDIPSVETSTPGAHPDLATTVMGKQNDSGLSPSVPCSEQAISTVGVHALGSPILGSKLNSECDSGSSVEKRKRGRPRKKREGLVTSPVAASPLREPTVHVCSPTESTEANETDGLIHFRSDHREDLNLVKCTTSDPTSPIIPMGSSNIPQMGGCGEVTSCSGADEPATPPKRKRGRPPKIQTPSNLVTSTNLHNNKKGSSPDRSPSPELTKPHFRRRNRPSAEPNKEEESTVSADTDDSSGEEEVTVRTPLTRSARTRLESNQVPVSTTPNLGSLAKPLRGRSHCSPPTQEIPVKRRKIPNVSSPSPPSSSPNGNSGDRQSVGGRKRPCPLAERILRSSVTAPPASNTRSSRPPQLLPNSPSSHRGRKAKT
ncbi:hypothetical protein GDO86_017631, partial [Hymenochirus boettgeri]